MHRGALEIVEERKDWSVVGTLRNRKETELENVEVVIFDIGEFSRGVPIYDLLIDRAQVEPIYPHRRSAEL